MKAFIAGAALAAALFAASSASAVVITPYVGADLTTSPYTIDFGEGGSLTFSTVDSSFFARDPTGVQTSGSAQIFSLGAPFFSQPTPTSYFTESNGSFGPGQLGFFASYSTPAAIPFSLSDGLVGFGFTLSDGLHYGYAQLGGSFLTGFSFEDQAGAGVPFGQISAVPEPGVWAMMIAGFALVGSALRRRRTGVRAVRA